MAFSRRRRQATVQSTPARQTRSALQEVQPEQQPAEAEELSPTLSAFGALVGQAGSAPPIDTTDGVAEGMDAAAVARNGQVHVHGGVASSGADLDPLMAHEMVHLAQGKRGGAPSSVQELEEEAELGAESLLAGNPFDVQHTAAPGQALANGLTDWFKSAWGKDKERIEEVKDKGVVDYSKEKIDAAKEKVRPKSAEEKWQEKADKTEHANRSLLKNDDGIISEADSYVGGREPVRKDHEFNDNQMRKVGGMKSTEKGKVKTTEKHSTSGEKGRENHRSDERTFKKGKLTGAKDTEEEFDLKATAKDADRALNAAKGPFESQKQVATDEKAALQQRRKNAQAEIVKLQANVDAQGEDEQPAEPGTLTPKQKLEKAKAKLATFDTDEKAIDDRIKTASDKLTEIETDQATLQGDPEQLESIVSKHGVKVEKKYKKTEKTLVNDSKAFDLKTLSKTHDKGEIEVVEEGTGEGARKDTHAKGREVTGSLKDASVSLKKYDRKSSEVERADFAGTDKTAKKKESETKIGLKGGPNAGHSVTEEEKKGGLHESKKAKSGNVGLKGGKLTGSAANSSRERDADGNVKESSSNAKLDTDGAEANKSASRGKETDHAEIKGTASASGAFTVKVQKIDGPPVMYKLITSIKGGVGGKGSSKLKKNGSADRPESWKDGDGDASVSGSVEVGASASYTHTRTLTADEAKSYLGKVDTIDKGGKPGAGHPEFGVWAKIKAIADNGGAEKVAAAVGNADSAKSMRAGDAFSLELEGTLGAGVDAGVESDGVSVGVGLEAKASVKRTLTVTRGAKDAVTVIVGFSDAQEATGKLNAGAGVAKGGVSATKGKSSGESVTFTLDASDPNYQTKYATISRTLTPDKLKALRETYKKDVTGRTITKGDKEGKAGNVEVKGAKLEVGENNQYDEKVELNGDKAGGTFTGGGGEKAGVSVAGVKLAGSDNQSNVKASATPDGDVNVDIENKEVENSLGMPEDLKMPTDGDEAKEQAKKLAKLKETIQKAETRLRGFKLDTGALNALIGRAGDMNKWANCAAMHPRSYGAWMGLRGRLLSPTIDPDWSEVDEKQAKLLGQLRALARFAEATGTDGAQCIENALRHWGEGTFGGGSKGKDLGLGYEWPPAISGKKASFEAAESGIKGLEAKFTQWLTQDDGLTVEIAEIGKLGDTVNGLQIAIQGCHDFDEPQFRAELLGRLSSHRTTLRTKHADFMKRWNEKTGATTDADLMVGDPERRVRELVQILRGLAADETRLLAKAEEELNSFFIVDGNEVQLILDKVSNSYDYWEGQINLLRTAYQAASIPEAEWLVGKPGSNSKTPNKLMPNIARFNTVKKRADGFDEDRAKDADSRSMLGKQRDRYADRERWAKGL